MPGPFPTSHPRHGAGRQSLPAGEKQARRGSRRPWIPDSDITGCRPQGKDKLCPLHRFHQGTGRVNLHRSFKSNPLCFFQTLLMHLREGGNGGLTSPVKDKWLSPISWPPSGRTPADQAADCIRQHISSSDHVERIAVWLR